MSTDTHPFPLGPGWCFLEDSTSVVVLRVNQAGAILAANRHATGLIGEPLVGRQWHTMLENINGKKMTLQDWLADTTAPRFLNNRTTLGLTQTLEFTVEPAGEDYLLFGEVSAAEQARVGLEVLELNQELSSLTRELAFSNAELEQHRDHLEELVCARTTALAKANEAAELVHRASEERIRMEAEARMRSRKLEAIGTLVAGIVHDFNNILGCIVGFAEMANDDLSDDSITKRNVDQILNASFRARDLIKGMLAFTRQNPEHPVRVDVADQVREALNMLRAFLPPSVLLSFQNNTDRERGDASVLADPMQIQQIVMNLCINAADAMNDHGIISICIDPAGNIKGAPPHLVDGVCLTVTDSGKGMTPEVLERMFDPFFSTKAPDKGNGVGLSVVHGIVTGLGGAIEARSRADGNDTGAELRVFLPLAKNKL
ncbi:MAG: ATP-binding protein [Sulfuricellaceae bacterium]